MPKGVISKKDSIEGRITRKVSNSDLSYSQAVFHFIKALNLIEERNQLNAMSSVVYHLHPYARAKEESENSVDEITQTLYEEIYSFLHLQWSRTKVERRLKQLERKISIHNSILEKIEAHAALYKKEGQEGDEMWPDFASEEFAKLVENGKALEGAGDDKELILYHVMEIESLLGEVEKKARATNCDYEARLAASLRDICKIHEPSELSNEQIMCFLASLQALIEGWGALNRDKVKWIRARLLEVGLTWLPVTKKAQKVINEAKSSVR